jgi:hypothetical protein
MSQAWSLRSRAEDELTLTLHVHVVPRFEDSDAEKMFQQRNYPSVEVSELRVVAAMIAAAL